MVDTPMVDASIVDDPVVETPQWGVSTIKKIGYRR
jgi:hypothetical protein